MSESEKNKSTETINPEHAFKMIERHRDDSNLVILDIRPKDEFEVEHIPGAIKIHLVKSKFNFRLRKFFLNHPIFLSIYSIFKFTW